MYLYYYIYFCMVYDYSVTILQNNCIQLFLCICVIAFKKVLDYPAVFILTLHKNLNSEYAFALKN